jgi:beta-phosphoglucomutase
MQPHCTINARRYRAVLFDLDGVILDTMKLHYEAFRHAFATLGIDVRPRDIYTREGMPSMKLGRALLEEYDVQASDEGLKKVVDEKRELYRQIAAGKTRPFPGVPETLALLRESGIKLALVTGSNRKSVTQVIEEAGLADAFDAIVTGEDTPRGKPYPDPYEKGMQMLGVDKAFSVVVENAPLGIKSARGAGADYIIAVTTTLPEEYLKEADDIMPSFADLGECLARRLEDKAI